MHNVRWLVKSDEDLIGAKKLKIDTIEVLSTDEFTLVRETKTKDSTADDQLFLKLYSPSKFKWNPIYVDYEDPLFTKQTLKRGKKDILARAVAGTKANKLNVFDATMGFGMDGFFLSLIGHQVVSCEQLNWLYALVSDALDRYNSGEKIFGILNWKLIFGNSTDPKILDEVKLHFASQNDVILCDPLFDEKRGSSPKEMQVLHELTSDHNMTEIETAFVKQIFESNFNKVVIKRPIYGKPLKDKVSYELKGRTIRYDVYRLN